MDIGPLATKIAFFNVFLGIVPGAARVCHGQRQQHTTEQGATQHAAKGRRSQDETNHNRPSDGQNTR